MADCPFHSQLEAYHDRELGAEAAARFEGHLTECPQCVAELRRLRELSSSIAARAAEIAPADLAAMHVAVNQEIDAQTDSLSLFRTAGLLAALAASVLIVCGIWWLDTQPTGSAGEVNIASSGQPAALSPEWELMATTLRADPSPGLIQDSFFSPRYAATLDFMLNSLLAAERSSGHLSPKLQLIEPPSWEKPKSF